MNLLQKFLPAVFGSGPALPDFIVVGARGAGVTWLSRQLSTHPRVWLNPVGETHFFTWQHLPEHQESITRETGERMKTLKQQCRERARGLNKLRRTRYLAELKSLPMHSPEWYRACFSSPAGSGVLTGEISTSYPRLPEEGIRAIKSMIPNARIIMVTRNPLDNVLEGIRRGASNSEQPLSAMDWQRIADRIELYKDTAHSEIQPLWEKVFGDELIHLPFEKVARDADNQLKQILNRIDPGLETPPAKAVPRSPEDSIKIPAPILKLATERTLAEVDFFKKRFQS